MAVESIEVICDGYLFATIVNEEVPKANLGRQKLEKTDALDTAGEEFPSAPTKPKKRRSRKTEEIITEID
jgi:hypothetical protein